jgi:hypothetical protein
MQGESFTFRGLQTRWRTVKEDPIAREIVDSMENRGLQILCIRHIFPFIQKQDLLRKNYMKELMTRVNRNQVVDGHERRTSTFIIRISDIINFVINNG